MTALHMIGPHGAPATGRSPGSRAEAAASWWTAWGCVAQVAVTDGSSLRAARRLVERELADTERAACRFRPDAEIHRLYRAGGRAVTVSPLLAELISVALAAAERTGGDVDPTVAAAVTRLGVGAPAVVHLPTCGRRPGNRFRPAPGWEFVRLAGHRLQVPPGVTLDLTSTAKALSCDRAARRVADRLGIGVSVALGGNVATAGRSPDGGWIVHLDDHAGRHRGSVRLPAAMALATSDLTGMVDPRTGAAVESGELGVWRTASAIGLSCHEASGYTAAALVRGPSARSWLATLGIPARLITVDDDMVEVAGWSDHAHHPNVNPDHGVPAPRIADPQRTTPR